MTDQSLPPVSETPNQPLPIPTEVIPQLPKKSHKTAWIVGGILACLLLVCCVVFAAVTGYGIYKAAQEQAPVAKVIDSYMKFMAAKDAEGAYALFSPRAQRQIPISKVKEMLDDKNYSLFEGYQNLTVTNINVSAVANTNPDVPQGTVAKVTGKISYEGSIEGNYNGVLEKVNGQWQIDAMFVTVPPSKIK